MRIATILLIIVLVLQSVLPCQVEAKDVCCDNEKGSITNGTTSHEEEHANCCSPLCQCACFSITVATDNNSLPVAEVYTFFNKRQYNAYNVAYALSVYLPIWQPPKI